MEFESTTGDVYYDPVDIIELRQLGEDLPTDTMSARDAAVFAYKLKLRAAGTVADAERLREGPDRHSQVELQRAHHRAHGLEGKANEIIAFCFKEYIEYLGEISSIQ